MKSFMVPAEHHAAVQRVLFLGRSGEASALPELIALAQLTSNEVQRLAASAIAKLAGFGADAAVAVATLVPLALHGRHPQTQQYALRALKPYAAAAHAHLHDLRGLANNPSQRDYARAAALTTVEAIEQALRDGEAGVAHRCQRCHTAVSAEEHRQAQKSFQRTYCGRCYDEVFLERRNFETKVELQKTVEARDGTLVQSAGERRIVEWLALHNLRYRYDAKFRIIGEFQIRPDFYLPEADLYIEYWGMDTPQYKMSMYKKQLLYQQEGKRLVSVYPQDLPHLDQHLRSKLSLFGVFVGERNESAKEGDVIP